MKRNRILLFSWIFVALISLTLSIFYTQHMKRYQIEAIDGSTSFDVKGLDLDCYKYSNLHYDTELHNAKKIYEKFVKNNIVKINEKEYVIYNGSIYRYTYFDDLEILKLNIPVWIGYYVCFLELPFEYEHLMYNDQMRINNEEVYEKYNILDARPDEIFSFLEKLDSMYYEIIGDKICLKVYDFNMNLTTSRQVFYRIELSNGEIRYGTPYITSDNGMIDRNEIN